MSDEYLEGLWRPNYTRFLLIMLIAGFIAVGCGGSGDDPAPSGDNALAEETTANDNTGADDDVNAGVGNGWTTTVNYNGTVATTIDYYDYDGSGNVIYLFTRDYTQAVSITIAPPKTVSANVYHDPNVPSTVRESNPFNLQMDTVTQGEEGNLGIASALLFNAMSGGELLQQYWTFTYSGQQVDGSLTNTHIAESQAANILWAWEEAIPGVPGTYPFYMDVGSTVQGNVTSQNVDVQFDGISTDGIRVFRAIVSASSID